MKRISQSLEQIIGCLTNIESSWKDEVSERVEKELIYLKTIFDDKQRINKDLVLKLLERDFDTYILIFRILLELSKDTLTSKMKTKLGNGIGKTAFKKDPSSFVEFFYEENLISAFETHLNRKWYWNDIIIERLKAGRGSAVRGQKRGRFLEEQIEKVIKNVFGNQYDKNCNFIGKPGRIEKSEFAIPDKNDPYIIFEAKAYGATGSKQTDVIGDIRKIIGAKRPRTEFLFVTDGITWKERVSDLKKIIEFQNNGDIRKIYTLSMMDELEEDLQSLKSDFGL